MENCINLSFYRKETQKWIKDIFKKWERENPAIGSSYSNYRISLKNNTKHMGNFEKFIKGTWEREWEVYGLDGKVYCFGLTEDLIDYNEQNYINFSLYNEETRAWIEDIFKKWLRENPENLGIYYSNYRVALKNNTKHMEVFRNFIRGQCEHEWEACSPYGEIYCFGITEDD